MNILIFSWRGPKHPNKGGAEVSTHEHAKAWARAGHKVVLFTSDFPGAKKNETLDNVKIIRAGHEVFGVHLIAFFWYLFGKHLKFDLVVDQFHGIPFFTPLYVKAKKLAFIHEVAKEVWWLNPWPVPFNLIPGIFGTVFEPLIFKILYKDVPFMTVSESTKKDLTGWGIPKRNITVIQNGVTLDIPRPFPKKEKKKTAMYLGALSKDKGIEDGIKTFVLINQIDPNWRFWIVGKGEEKLVDKLRRICSKSGIDNKVQFFGYVSDKKKFELLARAHALINPSVREGWGLVNIEANAVGTPVIAYDVPGNKDSIRNGKTGILCTKRLPEYLAREVIKLVESASYNKFCQQTIQWSKNFDWETSVDKSLKLIESLI